MPTMPDIPSEYGPSSIVRGSFPGFKTFSPSSTRNHRIRIVVDEPQIPRTAPPAARNLVATKKRKEKKTPPICFCFWLPIAANNEADNVASLDVRNLFNFIGGDF